MPAIHWFWDQIYVSVYIPVVLIEVFVSSDKLAPLRDQVTEYPSFILAVREGELSPQMYRNPFDIPRSCLLDQLTRMRANFLQVQFCLDS